MAALIPAALDKVEILPLVETALGWDLKGPDFPEVDVSLGMVEQFTNYGRIIVNDLQVQCLNIDAASRAGLGAQATLSEASRRLYLSPPAGTPHAAGRRAQNLARLIQGLLRAIGEVSEEQARSTQPLNRPARSTTRPSSVADGCPTRRADLEEGSAPDEARGERPPAIGLSPRSTA